MRRFRPFTSVVTSRDWRADAVFDIICAVRQLGRARGFAATVILTLSVGIGSSMTMGRIFDRLLFQAPPGIRDAHDVARILFDTRSGGERRFRDASNYPALVDFKRDVRAFESVAAYWPTRVSLAVENQETEARATLVSAEFFGLLRSTPALGRFFGPNDGYPIGGAGGQPLAVLSHGFWTRRFGGDSAILSRLIRIGRVVYTVVGVAQESFRGIEPTAPDVWLPMNVAAEDVSAGISLGDRGSIWLHMIARTGPATRQDVAEREATRVWRSNSLPPASSDQTTIALGSLALGRAPDRPPEAKVMFWLGGLSLIVLLLACVNVTNLLLARAHSRRREMAVRLALGADKTRIALQILAESLTFAGLSAVTAVALALTGDGIVQRLLASAAEGSLANLRLVGLSVVLAFGTTMVVSAGPLIQVFSADATTALRAGSSTAGPQMMRSRAVLLGTQAALCVVLLLAAGLFSQSLRRVLALDLGANLDRTFVVRLIGTAQLTGMESDEFWALALERVSAVPGVVRATLTEGDPHRSGFAISPFTATTPQQILWPKNGNWTAAYAAAVDTGFFATVGAETRVGRDFSSEDRRGTQRVAIINAPMARLLWPHEDALGKCFLLSKKDRDCVKVVGILPGFWRGRITERAGQVAYLPLAQRPLEMRTSKQMFVAIDRSPNLVLSSLRRVIESVRPGIPAVNIRTLREIAEPQVKPWRMAAFAFASFGVIALIIAAVGVYSVALFVAQQRDREIAIRIALGARRQHVVALVAKRGIVAVLAGLAIGIGIAQVGQKRVGNLLFQTSVDDPVASAGVVLLLAVAAVGASLLPAWQTMKRGPSAALRVE